MSQGAGFAGSRRRTETIVSKFNWRLSLGTQYTTPLEGFPYFFEYPKRVRSAGRRPLMYSWQDDYIAALAELDAEKQREYVYRAVSAIEQRRLSPLEPGSEEHQAIERAERALAILKRGLHES